QCPPRAATPSSTDDGETQGQGSRRRPLRGRAGSTSPLRSPTPPRRDVSAAPVIAPESHDRDSDPASLRRPGAFAIRTSTAVKIKRVALAATQLGGRES